MELKYSQSHSLCKSDSIQKLLAPKNMFPKTEQLCRF